MVDLKIRNVKFRYAPRPTTDAEYEYRVVHDAGLSARNPELAARYPDVDLGGPVSFVQRRLLRPREEGHILFGEITLAVAVPVIAWMLWSQGHALLGVAIAIHCAVLVGLSFLFPGNYWEVSPGTPVDLATERALPEAESAPHRDPMARTQAVPVEHWLELDLATRPERGRDGQ